MNHSPILPFVVDEKPFCLWDAEPKQINLDTINRIDPKYFSIIARILEPVLETDNKQYASVALRTFYSHALETLFALICATIQAPHCVSGWLLKYQNRDLFSVVRKIQNHEQVLTWIEIEKPKSWENIARAIFTPIQADEEEKSKLITSYSKLWERFASDFLNETYSEEYNSIKHGLRVQIGGFSFAIGLQEEIDVPAAPEQMKLVSKSDFGSSFFITEKIQNQTNFRVHHQSINWHPQNFINALDIISNSIGNILTFLKIGNSCNSPDLDFFIPNDDDFFKKPWSKRFPIDTFRMKSAIPDDVDLLTPEEIRSCYESQNKIKDQ